MATNHPTSRLGALIRQKRQVKGLSQLQLSEDAYGVPNKTTRISELENGVVRKPHPRIIDPIISVLGITEEELAECYRESREDDPVLDEAFRNARNLLEALAFQFEHANPESSLAQLDEFLRARAKEWRDLRVRLLSIDAEDEAFRRDRDRAEQALADGRLEEVDFILSELEERFQQQRTLVEVRKQAEIRVTRGDASLMNDASEAALGHYLQAARYIAPFDETEAADLLEENAWRIYEGSLRSFRPRFAIGTRLLEEAKGYNALRTDPLRRAQISYRLSLLYRNAGVSEENLELTRRALDYARSAEAYAIEANDPYQLATTRISLGNCLHDAGRHTKSRDQILLAVDAFRSARLLAVEHEEAAPLLSHACNSLASALLSSDQTSGSSVSAETVAEATRLFSEAIESAELHANFETWGAAKRNRGRMLAIQSDELGEADAAKIMLLVRAINDYQGAIETYPATFFPDRFAEAHSSMASVLLKLANLMTDQRNEIYTIRAVQSLEIASTVFEGKDPERWAECQAQIGSIAAYHARSRFAGAPELAFSEALKRFEVAKNAFLSVGNGEQAAVCTEYIGKIEIERTQASKS